MGTREAAQSLSVRDRTDRKRESGGRARQSVDLSICQSVDKIYPSMIASHLCVRGQESMSEPLKMELQTVLSCPMWDPNSGPLEKSEHS